MEDDDHVLGVSELAALVGMTPRNVRAHQSRGLLMPPRRRGRGVYYGPEHVARLRWVLALQERGYNLSAIKHLVDSGGGDTLPEEIGPPEPQPMSPAGLAAGQRLSAEAWEHLARAGLVHRGEDGAVSVPGRLLTVCTWAVSAGLPAATLASLQEAVARHLADVARLVAQAAPGQGQRLAPLVAEVLGEDARIGLSTLLGGAAEHGSDA